MWTDDLTVVQTCWIRDTSCSFCSSSRDLFVDDLYFSKVPLFFLLWMAFAKMIIFQIWILELFSLHFLLLQSLQLAWYSRIQKHRKWPIHSKAYGKREQSTKIKNVFLLLLVESEIHRGTLTEREKKTNADYFSVEQLYFQLLAMLGAADTDILLKAFLQTYLDKERDWLNVAPSR